MENLLIKGDNIKALAYLLNERGLKGKIDLIYTDPPFATNVKFTVKEGRSNTISAAADGEIAYTDNLLGKDFVEYIRERAILMRELLSERGSLYMHTDYKIGHYIKVMLDEVFGIENFRNDITRVKCNPKNFQRIGYGNIKDMILFYTKGKHPIWNEPKIPYSEADVEKLFPKVDADGRRYTTVPIHAPGESNTSKPFKGMMPPAGRHWRTDVSVMEKWDEEGLIEWSNKGNPRKKIFADEKEGKRLQDIWTEWKDPQYPIYPTEKNMEFIDMIINTSSDKDSIVLDCFCGSGSTLQSATRNGRTWIGIDKSELAIKTTKGRFDGAGSLFSVQYEYVEM